MIAPGTRTRRWAHRVRSLLKSFPGKQTFRALDSRSFALVWSGHLLSRIGDYLFEIALAWWILEHTGSPALMASILAATFVPNVLFLLIGGVAGDRFNRITLMLGADILRGIVVGGVAGLALLGLLQVWHLFVLNLLMGCVDAFFQPAYTATVPDLVSEDDLPSANALTSLSIQTGRIAGPALGAVLVAIGGTSLAFVLNALTFGIAALLLLPLLRRSRFSQSRAGVLQRQTSPSLLTDLREGIDAVYARPWLWLSILIFALSNVTLAGPFSVALPFLVHNDLHADVRTLGLLYALFPVGYILGGMWLGRLRQIRQRGRLIYGSLAGAGLTLLMFGLAVPLPVLAAAAIINGAMLEMGHLAWTTALQQHIPREQLGRVASIDALGSFALIPVGYGITGWLTELWGAPIVFAIGGGITALVAVLILASAPVVRNLD